MSVVAANREIYLMLRSGVRVSIVDPTLNEKLKGSVGQKLMPTAQG